MVITEYSPSQKKVDQCRKNMESVLCEYHRAMMNKDIDSMRSLQKRLKRIQMQLEILF